jgi:uncharacterized protein YcbX
MYTLSEINIFPIKSTGGMTLKSALVEERGLKYDRSWMLVYEDGNFFTQRDHPRMALLSASIENRTLKVSHKELKANEIIIPLSPDGSSELEVTVWNDKCIAQTYSHEVDKWFTSTLGFNCRLVYLPYSFRREVNTECVQNKSVSFADAYPFLIIGEKSLADLNKRLEISLPMNRFRTNFVFSGGNPFDEDKWEKIKIGNVKFDVVKPCARCVITTVNQRTSEKGKEPLGTLATFRKVNDKIFFGQNMVAEGVGEIKVGAGIEVLKWK